MWPPKEHLRRAFATHSPRINNMAPEDKHGVVAVVVVAVAVVVVVVVVVVVNVCDS